MKVVLLKDDKNLGKKGTVVEVKEGFGRNFLVPNGIATPATDESIAMARENAAKQAKVQDNLSSKLNSFTKKIQGKVVRVSAKASSGGTIYEGLDAAALGKLLKNVWKISDGGMKINPDLIQPIKDLGKYPLDVFIEGGQSKIKTNVILEVVAQE